MARNSYEALGHNSKAVHRAYARKAKVKLPSLESYEKQAAEGQIIQLPPLTSESDRAGGLDTRQAKACHLIEPAPESFR